MYTDPIFQTKKALREAAATGEQVRPATVSMFERVPQQGTVYIEGLSPFVPHTFYASATVENGLIVRVK